MSKTTTNQQVNPSSGPLSGFAALLTTPCYITPSRLWVSWLQLTDGDAPCPVLKTQLVGVDGLWSTPQIYSTDVLECTRNLQSPEPTRDSIWRVCIPEVVPFPKAQLSCFYDNGHQKSNWHWNPMNCPALLPCDVKFGQAQCWLTQKPSPPLKSYWQINNQIIFNTT